VASGHLLSRILRAQSRKNPFIIDLYWQAGLYVMWSGHLLCKSRACFSISMAPKTSTRMTHSEWLNLAYFLGMMSVAISEKLNMVNGDL
jgi:hypothetical protein